MSSDLGEENNENELQNLQSGLPPQKLPADLDLMVYKELWRWISSEILKEYWRKGGKRKVVNYGNVDFEPSFWPNEIWDWKDIKKNPKNLKTSDFPGPGNITEFLKEVIRRKFDQLNIDHTNFVDEKFTD